MTILSTVYLMPVHLFGYIVLSILLVATTGVAALALVVVARMQNHMKLIALAMSKGDDSAANDLMLRSDDIVDAAVNAIRFHRTTVGRVADLERQAKRRALTALDLISPEQLGRGLFDEFCLRTRPTSSSADDGMTWSLLVDMRPVAASAWVWVAKYVLALTRKAVENHCASADPVRVEHKTDGDGKCAKCGEVFWHIVGCPTREATAGAEVTK